MKKYIVIFLVLVIGCKPNIKEDPEYIKLTQEKDSIEQLAKAKDDAINEFVNSFNEIESNLKAIKEKESLIDVNQSGEVKQDSKDKIKQDIQLMYNLLQDNKNMVSNLKRKLKESGIEVKKLNQMIADLNARIVDQETQLGNLRNELAAKNIVITDLNVTVEKLETESADKSRVIDEKISELNTAYYVIGKSKDLIEKKVIDKAGGFIGLGKSKKLDQNINKELFTKIDITKTIIIPLMCKKIEIITSHPSSSYNVKSKDKIYEEIIITNPTDFWSASKYLVIIAE